MRAAVAHSQTVMDLSERRTCQIVGPDRTIVRYRSCRPPEAELLTRLRDLANERGRFGYLRLFILLLNEGGDSGENCIYRRYREKSLSVQKRKARRRATGTRAPILVDTRSTARWSIEFVNDQFACARRFRILTAVDEVTSECLTTIPDTSISSRREARALTTVIA